MNPKHAATRDHGRRQTARERRLCRTRTIQRHRRRLWTYREISEAREWASALAYLLDDSLTVTSAPLINPTPRVKP